MTNLYMASSNDNPVAKRTNPPHNFSHEGGNGGGDDMFERVKELENKVNILITDVAVLKDKVATKEDIQASKVDLHKELNAQTWKIIGSLVIAVLIAVVSKYYIK